jgi:hypothetical protein
LYAASAFPSTSTNDLDRIIAQMKRQLSHRGVTIEPEPDASRGLPVPSDDTESSVL